MKNVSKGVQFL